MLRKIIALLGLVALAGPSWATNVQPANYMLLFDLDSTSATYCQITGQNNSPFGMPIVGDSKISTVGSSATTTETADTDPFADLSVGDIIMVDFGTGSENVLVRYVAAKASVSSITVNEAWDLSANADGYEFRWLKQTCGTAATNGWISVAGVDRFTITFQMTQVNVTGGIDVQIQCKSTAVGATPVQVFPSCTTGACNTYQNYTTAGVASATTVVAEEPWGMCRVGVKIGTADDGGDLTTNAEQLSALLLLEKATR